MRIFREANEALKRLPLSLTSHHISTMLSTIGRQQVK